MPFGSRIRAFLFKRNRKLYPTSRIDRQVLLGGLIAIVLLYILMPLGLSWLRGEWRVFWYLTRYAFPYVVGSFFAVWVVSYLTQEPSKDEFEEYTKAIANIEGVGKELTGLVKFLNQERQRVAESEATLRNLQDEKTKLEPVVLAQRDTVNAILSAHARATASRAWKERMLGFITGLFASLIASMVVEYLRRR